MKQSDEASCTVPTHPVQGCRTAVTYSDPALFLVRGGDTIMSYGGLVRVFWSSDIQDGCMTVEFVV